MQSMNKVILIGRLAAKPEIKSSKNGIPFTRLRIATQRLKVAKDESENEATASEKFHTDWHSVFVWGQTAENCSKFLNKGALISIEGSLTYWEDPQDEVSSYKNAIRADQVQFLTYGSSAAEGSTGIENLDNFAPANNHNAVAHPA